jgi:glutathione S-transferase
MLLLQFSTSHYCRKTRLALGYKQIAYQVENLTPGLHIFRVKPLTGLTTVPVLITTENQIIGDSTHVYEYLEKYQPEPPLFLTNIEQQKQALLLEDWLDESIGTAIRFIYYDFRANEGKNIDSSWSSQIIINLVKNQYKINSSSVKIAKNRLKKALEILSNWQEKKYLVGDNISIADLTASALLSPLALIPEYKQNYPWLWDKIAEIHDICQEKLPPGLGN